MEEGDIWANLIRIQGGALVAPSLHEELSHRSALWERFFIN
jgi:hypothetical protein